jgi:hypothetical protein
MEDEYRTDLETVLKWTGDVDDYEEDIMNILKFQLKVNILRKVFNTGGPRYMR